MTLTTWLPCSNTAKTRKPLKLAGVPQNTCSTMQHAQPSDCSVTHCRNISITKFEIWISWNIDIPGSLNSCDSFPRRKFENRAPTSYRSCSMLSLSTISFELQAKVAEEIDLEMCSYGQLSEVQMLCDLDLDLGIGSGQSHINIQVRAGLLACPTMWL